MVKLKKLEKILGRMSSVLLAYSGGADSTFLLKVAAEVLPAKVLAVTAVSPTYPVEELLFSRKMAAELKVRHITIPTYELKDKRFVSNGFNRCYFCKRELFGELTNIARKNKIKFVVDASTVSDKRDFRPGNKAKEEFGVRSPLEEAGLTKDDIRRLSKRLGLLTWNKPSLACLASRIPYGKKISEDLLARIHNSETFLRGLGFKQVRLRDGNDLCRIEVFKEDIPLLVKKRNLIVAQLKRLGYNYITVDLEGYRTGSMNEIFTPHSRGCPATVIARDCEAKPKQDRSNLKKRDCLPAGKAGFAPSGLAMTIIGQPLPCGDGRYYRRKPVV